MPVYGRPAIGAIRRSRARGLCSSRNHRAIAYCTSTGGTSREMRQATAMPHISNRSRPRRRRSSPDAIGLLLMRDIARSQRASRRFWEAVRRVLPCRGGGVGRGPVAVAPLLQPEPTGSEAPFQTVVPESGVVTSSGIMWRGVAAGSTTLKGAFRPPAVLPRGGPLAAW